MSAAKVSKRPKHALPVFADTSARPTSLLTSTPTTFGLRVELMPHQKKCLEWMILRETQLPPGGILADDMGLGKTLSTLALVVHQKQAETTMKQKRLYVVDSKIYSSGTLIVAPASLVHQWAKEVEERVVGSTITVYAYHGPKSTREEDPQRYTVYTIMELPLMLPDLDCRNSAS